MWERLKATSLFFAMCLCASLADQWKNQDKWKWLLQFIDDILKPGCCTGENNQAKYQNYHSSELCHHAWMDVYLNSYQY
jgi:hypothetical protein